MRTIFYALTQAWHDLWYRRKLNAFVLLALCAGLLLPLFSVGRLLGAYTSLRDSDWPHAGQVAVVDGMLKFESETKLEAFFVRAEPNAQTVAFSATVRATAGWKGENLAVRLSGVSAQFETIEPMAQSEGRFWSQDEADAAENVCLVKSNGRLGGAAMGDSIALGQEMYKVIGVVRDPYLYGDVILPYAKLEPYAQGGALQYRMLFAFDAPLEPLQEETLNRTLQTREGMRLLNIQTAAQMHDEMKRSLWPVVAFEGAISATVLLFSTLGCILIFQGTIQNSAAWIGIRLAAGGTNQVVALQYLLQNVTLVLCAATLDLCVLPLLGRILQSNNAVPLPILAGWYFVLCICLALLITVAGLHGVFRKPIAQLLRANL